MGGACEARRGAVCPGSGEATSRRPEAIRRLRLFAAKKNSVISLVTYMLGGSRTLSGRPKGRTGRVPAHMLAYCTRSRTVMCKILFCKK